MQTKKLTPGITIFSVVLSLLLVALAPFLRNIHGNPFSSNMETYVHLTALNSNSLSFYDIVLKKLVALSSPQIIVVVLPLFFALGSLVFFLLLLKPRLKRRRELCATMLVLALTPAFIGMHMGLTLYAALLFFTLVAVYLFTEKYYLYLFFLFIIFLLDPLYATFLFAGIFFLEFFKKDNKHAILVLISYVILLFASSFLPFIVSFSFSFSFDINSIFSFLGGRCGYSLFLVLLGMGGFLAIHSKAKLTGVKSLQAAVLILSLFYEPLRLGGLLLLSYYSVQGFILLISRDWHVKTLQQLTALLFICILLFATSSYIKEEVHQAPTQEHIRALSYLRATIADHSSHATTHILSNPANTPFVEFFSGLETQDHFATELLASQSFSYVSLLFSQQDIAFVFVDPVMTQGAIWQRPEEGLLFVMNHNSKFKKIYDNVGYSIYYFLDWNSTVSQESS